MQEKKYRTDIALILLLPFALGIPVLSFVKGISLTSEPPMFWIAVAIILVGLLMECLMLSEYQGNSRHDQGIVSGLVVSLLFLLLVMSRLFHVLVVPVSLWAGLEVGGGPCVSAWRMAATDG